VKLDRDRFLWEACAAFGSLLIAFLALLLFDGELDRIWDIIGEGGLAVASFMFLIPVLLNGQEHKAALRLAALFLAISVLVFTSGVVQPEPSTIQVIASLAVLTLSILIQGWLIRVLEQEAGLDG
jgi:hypothetical protein